MRRIEASCHEYMPRHSKKQKRGAPPPKPENLDRFAGSSEEEDNDVDDETEPTNDSEIPQIRVDYAADAEETDVSEDDDASHSDDDHGPVKKTTKRARDQDEAVATDTSSESDDAESDAEENGAPASGMASAMARILGTQPSKAPSVVLSKTKTPLQKQAELEKQLEKELKEKRLMNREKNLAALHKPLSVATSAFSAQGASSSLQGELQQERAHRRIATRGVVALFNAITQHQYNHEDTENVKEGESDKKQANSGTKMTKNSFLDLIKNKAKAAAQSKTGAPGKNSSEGGEKRQWNAFRDDYMLDTKKPDWEDDHSSSEGEQGDGDISSGDEANHNHQSSLSKREKVRA